MKRYRLRLVITLLALASGTAFASVPDGTEQEIRTEPVTRAEPESGRSRMAANAGEALPQTAGDQTAGARSLRPTRSIASSTSLKIRKNP